MEEAPQTEGWIGGETSNPEDPKTGIAVAAHYSERLRLHPHHAHLTQHLSLILTQIDWHFVASRVRVCFRFAGLHQTRTVVRAEIARYLFFGDMCTGWDASSRAAVQALHQEIE